MNNAVDAAERIKKIIVIQDKRGKARTDLTFIIKFSSQVSLAKTQDKRTS